jgi:nucleoside-diphosphate-sugar epimerase
MRKIVITGAAGLVGQNLVARLKSRPDLELVGIDKHPAHRDPADSRRRGCACGALFRGDVLVGGQFIRR